MKLQSCLQNDCLIGVSIRKEPFTQIVHECVTDDIGLENYKKIEPTHIY